MEIITISVAKIKQLELSTDILAQIETWFRGWSSDEQEQTELVALYDAPNFRLSTWEGRPRFSETSAITISHKDFKEIYKNGKKENEDIDFFT